MGYWKMTFWSLIVCAAIICLFMSALANAQDTNQFWPTGIQPCAGCKENDESFPTYDDAIGKDRIRCYDEFELKLDKVREKIRKLKGKKQEDLIHTEALCHYTRFQACAGLDRKSWNLYFKGDFREGIKRGCLWK